MCSAVPNCLKKNWEQNLHRHDKGSSLWIFECSPVVFTKWNHCHGKLFGEFCTNQLTSKKLNFPAILRTSERQRQHNNLFYFQTKSSRFNDFQRTSQTTSVEWETSGFTKSLAGRKLHGNYGNKSSQRSCNSLSDENYCSYNHQSSFEALHSWASILFSNMFLLNATGNVGIAAHSCMISFAEAWKRLFMADITRP